MKWCRIRHKFASHIEDEWTYLEYPDDWKDYGYGSEDYEHRPSYTYNEQESFYEFLELEFGVGKDKEYSDKYRGFDCERFDGLPPLNEIEKRLKRAKGSAKHHAAEVDRFQNMMDQVGEIKKEDMEL